VAAGDYRLEFATGKYFTESGTEVFYPEVFVTIAAGDGSAHLHVPLLLSPFGYSTYKGT
jgi:5-hydroxyisourate hydrolase